MRHRSKDKMLTEYIFYVLNGFFFFLPEKAYSATSYYVGFFCALNIYEGKKYLEALNILYM